MKEKNCPCKRIECERHGDCDACNKHHKLENKKILTACERIKQKKKKK